MARYHVCPRASCSATTTEHAPQPPSAQPSFAPSRCSASCGGLGSGPLQIQVSLKGSHRVLHFAMPVEQFTGRIQHPAIAPECPGFILIPLFIDHIALYAVRGQPRVLVSVFAHKENQCRLPHSRKVVRRSSRWPPVWRFRNPGADRDRAGLPSSKLVSRHECKAPSTCPQRKARRSFLRHRGGHD